MAEENLVEFVSQAYLFDKNDNCVYIRKLVCSCQAKKISHVHEDTIFCIHCEQNIVSRDTPGKYVWTEIQILEYIIVWNDSGFVGVCEDS